MPTCCLSNHLYTFPFPVIRRHYSVSLTSLWDFKLVVAPPSPSPSTPPHPPPHPHPTHTHPLPPPHPHPLPPHPAPLPHPTHHTHTHTTHHTPHTTCSETTGLLDPLHRCAVIRLPLREHIAFHHHLFWLLSYTHKCARPLSQLKSLKPSDAYISQWVKPPSVQTLACLAIFLTDVNLLFIGAKEIHFYEFIFGIQTKNIFEKVICKMSVFSSWHQWVRVSFLNYMWTVANFSLSHKSFILIVMIMYILVPGHLNPGDLLLTWFSFNPSVDK